MIKIKKITSFPQNKILFTLGVILVVALVYGTAAYVLQIFPFNTDAVNLQKSQKADSDTKKNYIENQTDKGGETSTSPLTHSGGDVIVTTKQDSPDTVTVFTKLSGYSDGECKLDVSNNSMSYSKTANVIFQPEYSTCAGFTIPISELSNGTWSISLAVTSSGSTITKQLSVEVK